MQRITLKWPQRRSEKPAPLSATCYANRYPTEFESSRSAEPIGRTSFILHHTHCALNFILFNRAETVAHLRHTFPDATEQDIDEFHLLSSHNPRVQSMALSRQGSLAETLRRLGPDPTTVPDAIGQILDDAIAKLRDNASGIERHQIERICTGLAALRPLVPISVLASMSGISEATIRSFAFDLGRPLIVTGETDPVF